MPGPNDVLIARRAYEIWEEEGRPHGRDRDHWLKAVEEFSTTIVADPVVLKPIKAPAARPVTAPKSLVAKVKEAVTAPARTKSAPKKK
ncbi:MAG: DUF2934 domain-containing protein [Rhizobiales bacterium]|mgnify:CR=1 FL=1|nr:DUF2934 domain-containing protein [Hyphomicrobiales bacterium]